MDACHFKAEIRSLADWGQCFQSPVLFKPLVQAILRQENLPMGPLIPLTPGTHAVFAVGEVVIKVFAPEESGLDSIAEHENEVWATQAATAAGLRVPRILAHGRFADRYSFPYLIMERIDGELAANAWPSLSSEQKYRLCMKLYAMLDRLHGIEPQFPKTISLRTMPHRASRRRALHPRLAEELERICQQTLLEPAFFVHGDITADNLLLTADDDWVILDFADSKRAPSWYEWPPLLFDLFAGEKQAARLLSLTQTPERFIFDLVAALAVHEYGGLLLQDFFHRQSVRPEAVENMASLQNLLFRHYFS